MSGRILRRCFPELRFWPSVTNGRPPFSMASWSLELRSPIRFWKSSRTAAFLVAGAEKREILARFLQGDRDLPSARLAAVGKMRLFADAATTGRSVP